MTREELRVWFNEWACGCGSPEDVCEFVCNVLTTINRRWQRSKELNLFAASDRPAFQSVWNDYAAEMKALLPSGGIEGFVLYLFNHWDLLEHGGSCGGSWLTDKGRDVLEALSREQTDGFQTLCVSCCVHGYAIDDHGHDCFASAEGQDAGEPRNP